MADADDAIKIEHMENHEYAFVAEAGDVQIGWCRQEAEGWVVRDMDEGILAGPFKQMDEAISAGHQVLAPLRGASNPGW